MPIDPIIPVPGNAQPEPVKSTRSGGASASSSASAANVRPASGEDTVSLSSTHGEVQSLTASFANVPEVRTGRVNALQQLVSGDQYQPDSGKVADAIIADHSRVSAKA
jgi:flagellar biosynthesis anti-sigma factor FlgM